MKKNSVSFSISKVVDNTIDVLIVNEAEAEIVSLKKDKAVIRVKGKTSSTMDVQDPEKWKGFEGTITINYPAFQVMGGSKEDYIY